MYVAVHIALIVSRLSFCLSGKLFKEILLNNKCLPITSLVEIYNDSSLQKLYCRNSILLPWTPKRHKSIWIWIKKVSTWERLNKGLWFYDIISSWSTMMKNWKHNVCWSNWFYVILSSLWSCDHPLPVYIYMYTVHVPVFLRKCRKKISAYDIVKNGCLMFIFLNLSVY